MRTNIMRLSASLLLVGFMAPQAFAQDADGQADEEKKVSMNHYHVGTMTPPGQESMDIKYVMSMADGEHTAWIVTETDGEELKVEMMDFEMNEGLVSYNWSPADSDLIITCKLESVEDGGWAGECTNTADDGIGLMTMGPMTDHDGDYEADHDGDYEADEDHDAEHDADDDGDSVPVEDVEDSEADG